jgi:aryl-alcohol dehydrogenase-like predicted oxidoreductase
MSGLIDKLALGTAQFGLAHGVSNLRGRLNDAEARATLDFAADAGLVYLDTSADFGDAEVQIGKLAPRTRPFKVTTKTISMANGLGALENRARRSLRNLGAPSAYALLINSAEDLLGPEGDALWRKAQELKDAGLFEKIGVSVRAEDSPSALARRFKPDLMQLPVSLLDQRLVTSGELQALAHLGVEIQLRSIVLQGLLFLPRDGLPPELAAAGPRLSRIRREIAEAGADPLQAALSFALQRPEATSVIVGVASAAELRAIVAAATAPPPRLDWSRLALDAAQAQGVGLWAAA